MKKIDFISLCRSDYATLAPIFSSFKDKKYFENNLIFGGSHCLERFGHSGENILKDFPDAAAKLDFLQETDDTPEQLVLAASRLILQMNLYLSDSQPDAVFIVGDRWELLPVAYSCFLRRIPVLHHSGGDMTQGSMDNQTRYALTNISSIHFVAIKQHQDRLLTLGEEPWRVHKVGEPALNVATQIALQKVKSKKGKKQDYTLATFHPCLGDLMNIPDQTDFFLDCLSALKGRIIITGPNPDAYSNYVYKKIKSFSTEHANVEFTENLGEKYYEYLAKATLLIGNSSSGIWESATFKVPTINIGMRQEGRTRQAHIIDINYDIKSFQRAMNYIKSPEYMSNLSCLENIYYDAKGVDKIHEIVKKTLVRPDLINKKILL